MTDLLELDRKLTRAGQDGRGARLSRDLLVWVREIREARTAGQPSPRERYCPDCTPWSYFIRQGESGPIKIGFAADVERRRTELQQATHEKLIILAKTKDYSERCLHQFFGDEWIRGEWFDASPRLLKFIEFLNR